MDDDRRVERTDEPIDGEVTRSGWVPPKLTRWTFLDDLPYLSRIITGVILTVVLTVWMRSCGFMH